VGDGAAGTRPFAVATHRQTRSCRKACAAGFKRVNPNHDACCRPARSAGVRPIAVIGAPVHILASVPVCHTSDDVTLPTPAAAHAAAGDDNAQSHKGRQVPQRCWQRSKELVGTKEPVHKCHGCNGGSDVALLSRTNQRECVDTGPQCKPHPLQTSVAAAASYTPHTQ
jgi:hypothetical protein